MVISSPTLMGRTAVRTREKRLGSHSHFELGPQLTKEEWEKEKKKKRGVFGIRIRREKKRERRKKKGKVDERKTHL